jgi:peptide-methionine (S)-S-oxide reductase
MRRLLIAGFIAVIGVAILLLASPSAPEAAPAQAQKRGLAAAVFAGGCFWCTESDFDKMPGVVSTTSGYTAGRVRNPTYEQVSAGDTGHIEAVRVVYDPAKVSYTALVARFFRTVDPTDGGGQFCDRGPQYRSALFVGDASQRRVAEETKRNAAKLLGKPIATEILPAAKFYPAEDYHQDYYKKNPVRYRYYRTSCGRDARLRQVWGDAAH